MDADQLLRLELKTRCVDDFRELSDENIVALGLRYAIWLPRETYMTSPWIAPFAVRKIRIRSDVNAPGPARDLWGFPDSLGRFTDDNSLIKGVVRGRRTIGRDSPYGDCKLSTGLVCCHVWPSTTGDPLLFSFVPNLVWLPRSLAGYSDAHFTSREPHPLHFALRDISAQRYAAITPVVGSSLAQEAWSRLRAEDAGTVTDFGVELSDSHRVSMAASVRTARVIRFLDDLLGGNLPERRVSRRYHAGIGSRIDFSLPAIQSFVPAADLRELLNQLQSSVS